MFAMFMKTAVVTAIKKLVGVAKKVALQYLMKVIIPGYCGSRCDCATKQSKQSTVMVTVKTEGGQTVTVTVSSDDSGQPSPETKALAKRCRVPVSPCWLMKLLRMMADA